MITDTSHQLPALTVTIPLTADEEGVLLSLARWQALQEHYLTADIQAEPWKFAREWALVEPVYRHLVNALVIYGYAEKHPGRARRWYRLTEAGKQRAAYSRMTDIMDNPRPQTCDYMAWKAWERVENFNRLARDLVRSGSIYVPQPGRRPRLGTVVFQNLYTGQMEMWRCRWGHTEWEPRGYYGPGYDEDTGDTGVVDHNGEPVRITPIDAGLAALPF